MRRIGLQGRILGAFGSLLVGAVVGSLWVIDWHVTTRVQESVRRDLETSGRIVEELLNTRAAGLITAASLVSELSVVRDPSYGGDPLYLEFAANEINRLIGSEVVLLTDRLGVILARTDQRWELGEVFDETTSVARALRGERATSMWSHGGRLYQMVSVPLRLPSGLAGTLSAGYRVDTRLASELARLSGNDIVFLVAGKVVARSRELEPRERTGLLSLASSVQGGTPEYGPGLLGADLPAMVVSPLLGLAANPVGSYALLRSLEEDTEELRALEQRLVAVAAFALAAAAIVGWLLARSMTRPLTELSLGARELEAGNYDFDLPRRARSLEVEELRRAFESMRGALKERIGELARLTGELEARVEDRTKALQSALAENRRLLETLQRWNDELGRRIEERSRELAGAQQMLIRQDRMAAVGRLAAGVAHEINNPLGILAGFAEGLVDRARDPGLQALPAFRDFPRNLRLIGDEVDRLKTIVQKFLNFSRNRQAQKIRFDVSDVARQVLELLASQASREGKRLEGEISPFPLPVDADPEQLKQVLLNLVLNAFDAVERGGRVRVVTATDGDDGRIRVEDDGGGIPEELRDRVFEPFFSTKPPEKGTGLGLALCHDLVHDNGGRIDLVETSPSGTVFAVRLPLATAESTHARA